jgi:hypothetical protein
LTSTSGLTKDQGDSEFWSGLKQQKPKVQLVGSNLSDSA